MAIYNLDTWSKIDGENHPYLNVQKVGEGGNCVTYQVIRAGKRGDYLYGDGIPEAGNIYALKFFKDPDNIERKERFLDERDFLNDIEHPSIMRYYDRGTWRGGEGDEFPFFVMEYLPYTLEDVIQANRASIAEKLGFATQLISGLVFMRDNGIIHRDIKPKNIFIKGGSSVIGDFGLMKRDDTDSEEDEAKALKESTEEGIPNLYPSPDLIEYEETGQGLTYKSDVFQMGLVLTRLFTRTNQIPIENVRTRDDHDEIEVEDIANIPGETISREVSGMLSDMVEKEPEDRIEPEDVLNDFIHKYKIAAEESRSLNGRVM